MSRVPLSISWLTMALAAMLLLMGGCSDSGSAPVLSVRSAVIPAPAPGQGMAALYAVVSNSGAEDLTVLSVSVEGAAHAEVHRTAYDQGVMTMRPAPHPKVPAGGELRFEPSGLHIMLHGIDPGMKPGDRVVVSLSTEEGPALEFEAPIVQP